MWTRPTLTAFASSFQDNYDGPILEFWESQIIGDIGHVADLACGNGALTWIANDLLNKHESKTKVTGVDYAKINPFQVLERNPKDFPQVSFIGDTGVEKLPFADGSIDLVISQYGLEYSDLD
ncbi:MAG: class I SAM-dependent methyltransferase [Gammaproteobacteria bacterium]|nr:class I SAM-dependent methyltransferase [Gammaproteobacteria bacterium]